MIPDKAGLPDALRVEEERDSDAGPSRSAGNADVDGLGQVHMHAVISKDIERPAGVVLKGVN